MSGPSPSGPSPSGPPPSGPPLSGPSPSGPHAGFLSCNRMFVHSFVRSFRSFVCIVRSFVCLQRFVGWTYGGGGGRGTAGATPPQQAGTWTAPSVEDEEGIREERRVCERQSCSPWLLQKCSYRRIASRVACRGAGQNGCSQRVVDSGASPACPLAAWG